MENTSVKQDFTVLNLSTEVGMRSGDGEIHKQPTGNGSTKTPYLLLGLTVLCSMEYSVWSSSACICMLSPWSQRSELFPQTAFSSFHRRDSWRMSSVCSPGVDPPGSFPLQSSAWSDCSLSASTNNAAKHKNIHLPRRRIYKHKQSEPFLEPSKGHSRF